MTYSVSIFSGDDTSIEQRAAAAKRFCATLEAHLGDASLVVPIYAMYQRLTNTFGDTPDVRP